MNVKKIALTGLISSLALIPAKAQKTAQYIPEVGITGRIQDVPTFYAGLNVGFPKGNNYADVFAGMTLSSGKKASFLGLAMDNYNWTQNISSWARGVLVASNRGVNSTLELSPLRANIKAGKFNMSLNPAYTIYNDFKNKQMTQGVNTIFQTTYSMTPNDKIFVEAKYTSDPAKNIFNTHFGKLKNNISYMIAYMMNF